MNLTQEQFFAADVAKATGFEPTVLQNVLKRGHIDIPNAKPGSGGRRMFTAETVLQLAFARHLMEKWDMGPLQSTHLVSGVSTRNATHRETLEYLNAPSGREILFITTTRTADDTLRTAGYTFADESAAAVSQISDAIKVPVGAIAKEVLAKLEGILAQRKGDVLVDAEHES